MTRDPGELRRRDVRVVGAGHRVEDVVGGIETKSDEARADDRQQRGDRVEEAVRRGDQDAQRDRYDRRRQERQARRPQGQEPERQLGLDRRPALHRQRIEVGARLPDGALRILEEGDLRLIPAPGRAAHDGDGGAADRGRAPDGDTSGEVVGRLRTGRHDHRRGQQSRAGLDRRQPCMRLAVLIRFSRPRVGDRPLGPLGRGPHSGVDRPGFRLRLRRPRRLPGRLHRRLRTVLPTGLPQARSPRRWPAAGPGPSRPGRRTTGHAGAPRSLASAAVHHRPTARGGIRSVWRVHRRSGRCRPRSSSSSRGRNEWDIGCETRRVSACALLAWIRSAA